jgi:DNA invertase Pin-like site-specific DNA recombinase
MQETPERLVKRLESLRKQSVWGYVRVSSETQEDNQSFGMQKADIEKYCLDKKMDPPQFVNEVASAAKPLWVVQLPGAPKEEQVTAAAPRPMLLTLLMHLKQTREHLGKSVPLHLIVWKLDRLARVDYEQELFITMFQRDGVRLHSVMPTENHMLDGGHIKDPARAFTRTVLAAAAQYERAMIELRLSSGLTYKAAQGGFTGGVPPFGYGSKGQELVIIPHEAQMVKFIFHLRYKYQLSESAISRYIIKHKAVEDTNLYDRYKIRRILQNKSLYQGVYKDRYGSTHPRPDLKILSDDPEALLDYEQTQPQRTESVGLPGADHQATAERAGDDHRPDGSAGDERGQESPEAGLPADPQRDVPASGGGEPRAGGSAA